MAKRKKTAGAKKKAVRRSWSEKDLETLRKMAPTRPAGLIAYELGRTEGALRNKAHTEGISFGSPERSPYGKPATRGKKKSSRAKASRKK